MGLQNTDLTTDEIARLLRTTPATIGQWISTQGLPAVRVDGQWHCTRANLEDWLAAHKISVPGGMPALGQVEAPAAPSFAAALEAGGIHHNLACSDKRAALVAAVQRITLPPDLPREQFLQRLLEREELTSTGVGDGVAIPHPRDPFPQMTMPLVALCFPAQPLNFDALDGQPVHAIFVLASPTPKIHLHILSRLFFLLRKPEFRGLIQPGAPAAQIMEAARLMEPR